MATATPVRINSGTRTIQLDRSKVKRELIQKTSGVTAAHIHDPMNSSAIGPTGDITRNPNPRGSSNRFIDERTARNVQNAKMKRSSSLLSLQWGWAFGAA